jgi:hypothetical protein
MVMFGCSTPGYCQQPYVDTAARIQEHQQQRALQIQCEQRDIAARQSGASASQIAQMDSQCRAQIMQVGRNLAQHEIAADPTIYGQTTRLMMQAQSAEQSGDKAAAISAYQAVVGNGPAMLAEYARAEATVDRSANSSIQSKSTAMNVAGLTSALAIAETKIGYSREEQRDYSQAAAWYGRAISNNTDGAMVANVRLGLLYAYGLGVPRDLQQTRRLFEAHGRGNGWDYLLDHNALPSKIEQVTPEYVESVKRAVADKEAAEKLTLIIVLLVALGSGHSNGPARHQNCYAINRAYAPGFAGMQGCWPY